MRQLEGIGHIQIVDEIGIQGILLALEVVKILARHILRVQRGSETLVIQHQHTAHGHAGREGDGGVAFLDGGLGPHVVPAVGIIVAHIAHVVLDAVAAQRCIHFPSQPVGKVHSCQ